MATLIPTPVLLQELMDITSDINQLNDGVKTLELAPRTTSPQLVVVQVLDDPLAVGITGSANANVVNALVDTTVDFVEAGFKVGDIATNVTAGTEQIITAITTTTNANDTLVFLADIFPAGTENYFVSGASFWVQRFGGGEWQRSNIKYGINARVTYIFPAAGTAASAIVHSIVYPTTAPEDTGNYPPSNAGGVPATPNV